MGTKRRRITRELTWTISPSAVKLWALFLEISAQPRDAHGELCDEDAAAERDVLAELGRVVGFNRFSVGIELAVGVGDEPPDYLRNNSAQLQVWQEAREIKTALDHALLRATA